MYHELKTHENYFQEVYLLNKTFECRKNDRDFKVYDTLILKEFNPVTNTYSGREIYCSVRSILTDEFEGVAKGYCILSIKNINYINQ